MNIRVCFVFGVFLLLASTSGLFGQGLDDYLDKTGEAQPPDSAVTDVAVPATGETEKKEVSGYFNWLKGNNIITEKSTRYAVWSTMGLWWGTHDELKKLKEELKGYGVTVNEGRSTYWGLNTEFKPSPWTTEQIQGIINIYKNTPTDFNKATTAFYRCQQGKNGDGALDGNVEGTAFRDEPNSVYVFDSATKNPAHFQQVLLHEMSHCWCNSYPGVLPKFETLFDVDKNKNTAGWRGDNHPAVVRGPSGIVGVQQYALTSVKGGYRVGGTVSQYGDSSVREDFAETMSAFYGFPQALSKFPKRFEFAQQNFPVPTQVVNAGLDAKLYGFSSGAGAENYPHTFFYSPNPQAGWTNLAVSGTTNDAPVKNVGNSVGWVPGQIFDFQGNIK